MKKIVTIVFLACVALGMYASESVLITAPDTVIDKTAYTLEDKGITIDVSYGSAYPAEHAWNNLGITYFACLASGSITFSADDEMDYIAINGWVKKNFSATCDHGTIDYLSDAFEDSTGEPVLTISSIESKSVTIHCNNQLRCFSVEVVFKEAPEAVEMVKDSHPASKIMRNGQLFIIRNDRVYTVSGSEVR